MNQGSSSCSKASKLSNIRITDWTNMAYSLLTGCLNAFTNLFSQVGFSSGSFSVWSSSKSKLDRTYGLNESQCINVVSKHFPRLSHLVETWLTTFLTLLFLKFINSLSWFFCFALLQKWPRTPTSITKSSTFTESSLTPFPAHKRAKW